MICDPHKIIDEVDDDVEYSHAIIHQSLIITLACSLSLSLSIEYTKDQSLINN